MRQVGYIGGYRLVVFSLCLFVCLFLWFSVEIDNMDTCTSLDVIFKYPRLVVICLCSSLAHWR